jgi:hypothetical protein
MDRPPRTPRMEHVPDKSVSTDSRKGQIPLLAVRAPPASSVTEPDFAVLEPRSRRQFLSAVHQITTCAPSLRNEGLIPQQLASGAPSHSQDHTPKSSNSLVDKYPGLHPRGHCIHRSATTHLLRRLKAHPSRAHANPGHRCTTSRPTGIASTKRGHLRRPERLHNHPQGQYEPAGVGDPSCRLPPRMPQCSQRR